MHNYTIIERLPGATDYNRLREAVGWGAYRKEVIARSLPHSCYCVCAVAYGQVVGMARIVGDGGLVYYIQDVIVLPAFQGQGIGTRIMDRIMAYIGMHASHNTIIGLMAAKGKEAFYERYGFIRRPSDRYGAGMIMFWRDEPAR
jgi:GNAT superfamily N-acetyltransferase